MAGGSYEGKVPAIHKKLWRCLCRSDDYTLELDVV
jgi:hypothetical protein